MRLVHFHQSNMLEKEEKSERQIYKRVLVHLIEACLSHILTITHRTCGLDQQTIKSKNEHAD